MPGYFEDMPVDVELLPHRVNIERADHSVVDDGGGGAVGTTLAPGRVIHKDVAALVSEMSGTDRETWSRLGIDSSHDVYFGRELDLHLDDVIVWGNRRLLVRNDTDHLGMGIVFTVQALERKPQ